VQEKSLKKYSGSSHLTMNNIKKGAMLNAPIARQQVINKFPPPPRQGHFYGDDLGKGARVDQGTFCWLANRNSIKLSNIREVVAKGGFLMRKRDIIPPP
jgi:hypothetical protein